jgi:excisionase family DNA binding protein
VEEPGEVADGESQDVLSIQEVAKLLNVPVSTIYAWKRRGEGPPYYKVGRKLRFRVDGT